MQQKSEKYIFKKNYELCSRYANKRNRLLAIEKLIGWNRYAKPHHQNDYLELSAFSAINHNITKESGANMVATGIPNDMR